MNTIIVQTAVSLHAPAPVRIALPAESTPPGDSFVLMDEASGYRVETLDVGFPTVRDQTSALPTRDGDLDYTRLYGPDFPPITLPDIVAAQRLLLDRLGVRALVAVVGPSYGGFQAFSWAIEHPDFMRAIVPVVTGLRSPRTLDMDALAQRFAADPGWNGGQKRFS